MSFTDAELAERRGFLGGSEAPAAIGFSPFFTQLELYKSKLGEGEPFEESLPILVGNALEPVTLSVFEKKTGLKVTDRQQKCYDLRIPWRRCTIDGRAENGWLVQAKSSGVWQNWGKDVDAVPASVIYQCQHELACNPDAPGSYVPVILGQREFRLYEVERNAELIAMLTAEEKKFMRYVHERTPPPPVNNEDLKLLYPTDVGTKIVATDYIAEVAYNLASTKAELRRWEKVEDSQSFEIREFMKDAAILVDSKGNPLFTNKANIERRMDVTAFRKDHPALADQYSPEKTVRKLLCKIKL